MEFEGEAFALDFDIVISPTLITSTNKDLNPEPNFQTILQHNKILPGSLEPMHQHNKMILIIIILISRQGPPQLIPIHTVIIGTISTILVMLVQFLVFEGVYVLGKAVLSLQGLEGSVVVVG